MHLLFRLIILILIGSFCAQMAQKKGRDPKLWFILGVIIGLIAVVILVILRPKPALSLAKQEAENENPANKSSYMPAEEGVVPVLSGVLWYYLDQDHHQFGPMSFTALKNAFGRGNIEANFFVWNENMEEWKILKDLPEVFREISQTS